MFACLYSLSAPQSLVIKVAQDFTPRYEVIGPLVMLDLSGLSRLFGTAREIGDELRQSMGGAPVRIAIAQSQTAAALLALGRPGLTVVSLEAQPKALASLQVHLLGELERIHSRVPAAEARRRGENNLKASRLRASAASTWQSQPLNPPHIAEMDDVLPYFQSCLDRTSEAARAPHAPASARVDSQASYGGNCGGGWQHPRDSHASNSVKRERRAIVTKDAEREDLLSVLKRWGVKTLGALAELPAGDVYERLGARGVIWQRLARGADQGPLVPCVPEDPFEGTLDLEWPIEGLEPLSFVLARLFEPLSARLERADRGAAILHTHLRLTTHPSTGAGLREVYARTVQLPAPMRDPKTLRALVLLDLESNPPSAAIDRVRVLIEPTPARVLQWTLYERAQPSPEQVSTLLARLTALMGDGHVGSPALVNSWKPGAFELRAFAVPDRAPAGIRDQGSGIREGSGSSEQDVCATALRRFRLPIPARVQMQDGRPVRVMIDRRGVTGGAVKQSAGPWRTSGEWWNDGQTPVTHQTNPTHQTYPTNWDRDEWDVLLNGGEAYRIYVERDVGQWFVEGIVD
jgi:protein ImuB